MTTNGFLRMFEEIVLAAPGSLNGSEELQTLENWDSLAVVVFLAQADKDFSVNLSHDDISSCRTVNDLSSLLDRKASVASEIAVSAAV